MSNNRKWKLVVMLGAAFVVLGWGFGITTTSNAAEKASENYRVLAPIESGNLLLFPVVRADGKSGERSGGTGFLTLDEGIKSGEVEVTEAGKVQGLVRPRGAEPQLHSQVFRGDEVNTLVLVNNSKQPLLLLAGEIVTGGKQDRVIAKDRIVPAESNPIDLSVFCIEPGRWTESSAKFGAAANKPVSSFMVQPTVRQQAMVAKDQRQVWNAVGGAIATMEAAPPPPSAGMRPGNTSTALSTSSYAKAMQDSSVSLKVDEAAAPVMKSRDEVLASLRKEHAIGVVVAVRGEILWADLFADTDLLSRYWTKLVRSYAAESLTRGETHPAPGIADAQRFLNSPVGGTEKSEGQVGIYRYREMKSDGTDTFVLESLLPQTNYDVHISKLKLKEGIAKVRRGPGDFHTPYPD